MSTDLDDLRSTLARHAEEATGTVPAATRASLAERRGRRDRTRRRAVVGTGLAAAAVAVVAVVGLPHGGGPDQTAPVASASTSPSPARPSAGKSSLPFPDSYVRDGRTYTLSVTYLADTGGRRLTLETTPASQGSILSWASTPRTPGQLVVSIDGVEATRTTAGHVVTGLVLPAGKHVVVLRAPRLRADESLGLATYQR